MSDSFGYRLSYFRPEEESSVDVWINTAGRETYGFQVVADIKSDSPIEIIDQSANLPEIQLSVESVPTLSFITNKVVKTETGYKLALAAITSNPKVPFQTNGEKVVAKLIFKQKNEGNINISLDTALTKLPVISEEITTSDTTSNLSQPSVQDGSTNTTPIEKTTNIFRQPTLNQQVSQYTIKTQKIGEKLELLNGENMIPPTNQDNQQEYFAQIDQNYAKSEGWKNQI